MIRVCVSPIQAAINGMQIKQKKVEAVQVYTYVYKYVAVYIQIDRRQMSEMQMIATNCWIIQQDTPREAKTNRRQD